MPIDIVMDVVSHIIRGTLDVVGIKDVRKVLPTNPKFVVD